MTQPPFAMDPTARFDDEVARIARENDADVVFQLVEREDVAVSDTDKCCIHNQAQTRWATNKLIVESKETGQKLEKGLCDYHAGALREGNWPKAARDTDPRKFQNLKEAAREKDRLTVSVVRKVGEPDRGRSLNLASDRPPNVVRPEPTIVPPPPPERPGGGGGGSAASAAAAREHDRTPPPPPRTPPPPGPDWSR